MHSELARHDLKSLDLALWGIKQGLDMPCLAGIGMISNVMLPMWPTRVDGKNERKDEGPRAKELGSLTS